MQVTKVCEYCGSNYELPRWRAKKSQFCSKQCADSAKKAPANTICTFCGKGFHMKPFQKSRYERHHGFFCSRICYSQAKKELMSGKNNHQYGLKGELNSSFSGLETLQQNGNVIDIMVYSPTHPFKNKNGRVKKHRLIVEENYQLFDSKYFMIIENNYYLKPKVEVHHLDGNHNNNELNNLIPCTKAEHKQYHKSIITERNDKGQIVHSITVVDKQGELLEG